MAAITFTALRALTSGRVVDEVVGKQRHVGQHAEQGQRRRLDSEKFFLGQCLGEDEDYDHREQHRRKKSELTDHRAEQVAHLLCRHGQNLRRQDRQVRHVETGWRALHDGRRAWASGRRSGTRSPVVHDVAREDEVTHHCAGKDPGQQPDQREQALRQLAPLKGVQTVGGDEGREKPAERHRPVEHLLDLVAVLEPSVLESAESLALVKKYFDRVPKARHSVPRDIRREPPQTGERRVTITEDQNWPLPAVIVAYHITYDGHPDAYPLHIAAKLLSDGQSSRIFRRLVYDDQLAVSAFGAGNIIEDPNLFYAVSIVQPGRTPEESEAALIGEFDRLKNELISDKELERAKNQFARDYVFGRATVEQKANLLSHAAVIHDDITTADAEYDIFMDITKEDVRRVARTYFTEENRMVLTIQPPASVGRSFLRPGDDQ